MKNLKELEKVILLRSLTVCDNMKTLCQVKEASHKTTHPVGVHSVRYIEQANSQRQKVEWWLLGAGGGPMGVSVQWGQSCSFVR